MKTHEKYLEQISERNITNLPLEPYKGAKISILHRCKNNHEWKVTPSNVLTRKNCPRCVGKHMRSPEEYVDDLLNMDTSYVPLVDFINTYTKIPHQCLDCNNVWDVKPSHILRGHGCPVCMSTGFDVNKPGILYYVRIGGQGQVFYKIGITNGSVHKRFNKDKDKSIIILMEKYYLNGSDAKLAEDSILQEFKEYRIKNPGYLKSHGNSELFKEDILALDK